MRTKQLLTVTVAALLSLTACSGDGDDPTAGADPVLEGMTQGQGADGGGPNEGTLENPSRNGGVNGSAPDDATGFASLPVAVSMKTAAGYVGGLALCDELATDPEDERFYDADSRIDGGWGVSERGVCGSRREPIRIFMVKDMKKFQASYKAELDQKRQENPSAGMDGGFAIGQDFAVITADSDAANALSGAELLILNCNPSLSVPSGYSKEKALVDGCALTDSPVS